MPKLNPQSEAWLNWYEGQTPEKQAEVMAGKPLAKQTAFKARLEERKNAPSLASALGLGSLEGLSTGHTAELNGVADTLGMSGYEKAAALTSPIAAAGIAGVRGAQKLYTHLTDPSSPNPIDQYRQSRDQTESQIDRAREEHPLAVGTTELAGGLATAAAGVGPLAYGLAAGSGHSRADLTKGEVGPYLGDVGKSGALAAALGYYGGKIGDAGGAILGRGAGAAESLADRQVFKAFHPDRKAIRALSLDEQQGMGHELNNSINVMPWNGARALEQKVAPVRESVGRQIGQTYDKLDEKAAATGHGPDADIMIGEVWKTTKDTAPSGDTDLRNQVATETDRYANDYGQETNATERDVADAANPSTFRNWQKEKQSAYRKGYEATGIAPKPTAASALYRQQGHAIGEGIDIEARKLDPAEADKLKGLNARHKNLASAQDIADAAADKEQARAGLSVTDMLLAGAVGLHNPGGAIPAIALRHALRTRGNASAAFGANAIAKALGLGAKVAPEAGSVVGSRVGAQYENQLEEEDPNARH